MWTWRALLFDLRQQEEPSVATLQADSSLGPALVGAFASLGINLEWAGTVATGVIDLDLCIIFLIVTVGTLANVITCVRIRKTFAFPFRLRCWCAPAPRVAISTPRSSSFLADRERAGLCVATTPVVAQAAVTVDEAPCWSTAAKTRTTVEPSAQRLGSLVHALEMADLCATRAILASTGIDNVGS